MRRMLVLAVMASIVSIITASGSAQAPQVQLTVLAPDAAFAVTFQRFAEKWGVSVRTVIPDRVVRGSRNYTAMVIAELTRGGIDGWLSTTGEVAETVQRQETEELVVQTAGPYMRAHIVARDTNGGRCAGSVADIGCLAHRGLDILTATGESSYMAGILTKADLNLGADCETGAKCRAAPDREAATAFLPFLDPSTAGELRAPRMIVYAASETAPNYENPLIGRLAGFQGVFLVSLKSVESAMSPLAPDTIPPKTYTGSHPPVATVADLGVTVSRRDAKAVARMAYSKLAEGLRQPSPLLPADIREPARQILTRFLANSKNRVSAAPGFTIGPNR